MMTSVVIWVLISLSLSTVAQARQPNILIFVADDLGWNDVSYHGSVIQTPNIDRLSAEGVRLENYYVQPLCTPSRDCLMTGNYQIRTGLQHRTVQGAIPKAIPLDFKLLPEYLKDLGYATHLIGKWHLGHYAWEYTPTRRGFDSFLGIFFGGGDYYDHTHCAHDDCGLDFHTGDGPQWDHGNRYSTFLYTEEAERIIRDHSPEQPLYMHMAFQSPHTPLQVPEEYMADYDFITDTNRRILAGMVTCMDEAVGNITTLFQEYGLWDDTIVVFTTDNGGANIRWGSDNYPLRGGKDTYFDGGIRGVAFVRGGNIELPSRESHEFMHISDWFPTLIHQAGGSTDGVQLDSFDVWNSISLEEPSPRDELLINIDPLNRTIGQPQYDHDFDTRVQAGIRQGRWKLITGFSDLQNVLLFDMVEDPYEDTELSAEQPDIVYHLLDLLAEYNSTAVEPQNPPVDENGLPSNNGGAWGPWLEIPAVPS